MEDRHALIVCSCGADRETVLGALSVRYDRPDELRLNEGVHFRAPYIVNRQPECVSFIEPPLDVMLAKVESTGSLEKTLRLRCTRCGLDKQLAERDGIRLVGAMWEAFDHSEGYVRINLADIPR